MNTNVAIMNIFNVRSPIITGINVKNGIVKLYDDVYQDGIGLGCVESICEGKNFFQEFGDGSCAIRINTNNTIDKNNKNLTFVSKRSAQIVNVFNTKSPLIVGVEVIDGFVCLNDYVYVDGQRVG